MNIFLSYGHDEYEKFARRIKRDLEAQGIKVWMDVDGIKGTADWENAIENGINGSDWFVIMMTQHSCRRPDGVCLDEVSYARFLGKSIAPIMIENVKPPLCIARIQYIDMENFFNQEEVHFDEESYQERFATLINILHGINEISQEGNFEILHNRLIPLDNDVYYEHFRHNFYGRDKLFDYYHKWVKSDSRLLWIVGNAGVGKTAFIAKLTENNDEISAVHFCRYNDSDRANAKRAIMTIAFYLSTQIEEYKNLLLNLHDLDKLLEKSVDRLFAYLLIEPLNKVGKNRNQTVVVIDALDEATFEGRNELADIIASKYMVLPSWLKIIITSRDEPILRRKLSKIRPITFEDAAYTDNHDDILGYFRMRLESLILENKEEIIDVLLKKSAGNFLYAKTVTDDILSGVLPISEPSKFPNGLTGVYASYFDRIVHNGKCDYRREIRPVLEVLCAEYSPICSDEILSILDLDEYDFDDIKEEIAQMFPEKNNIMEPIHKSIVDWLVDREKAGTYRVSLNKGHKRLANYSQIMKKKHVIREYDLKYACRHFINAEMFDEAIDLLNDYHFQNRRISTLGLDSALREYLFEISSLVECGIDVTEEIYMGDTFKAYFSKYRKFLYNTGLYFVLKNAEFDKTLHNSDYVQDVDIEVGVANYWYITERFDLAIKVIKNLLQRKDGLASDTIIELNNLLALCYRKYVVFDLAKDHFLEAFNNSDAKDDDYDKSISAINLGKIAYHELDWGLAEKWNNTALGLLENSLNQTDSEDMRVNIELFIAEYHRLISECVIWNFEIEKALQHLAYANRTYEKIASRDRYYVRYLYTSALVSIFSKDFEQGLRLCEEAWEIATSKYDKSQILFYRGIALTALKMNSKAVECIDVGLQYAKEIGAWLECEEITLLKNVLLSGNEIQHSDMYYENEYIRKWADYALSAMERVIV